MDSLFVAKEIINQLRATDPWALGAWGTKNITGSDRETSIIEMKRSQNKKVYYALFGVRGWVRFNVNAAKFKGQVYIGLNAMDLYDVLLVKQTNHKTGDVSISVKDQRSDIYCDQLMEVIDNLIERN